MVPQAVVAVVAPRQQAHLEVLWLLVTFLLACGPKKMMRSSCASSGWNSNWLTTKTPDHRLTSSSNANAVIYHLSCSSGSVGCRKVTAPPCVPGIHCSSCRWQICQLDCSQCSSLSGCSSHCRTACTWMVTALGKLHWLSSLEMIGSERFSALRRDYRILEASTQQLSTVLQPPSQWLATTAEKFYNVHQFLSLYKELKKNSEVLVSLAQVEPVI